MASFVSLTSLPRIAVATLGALSLAGCATGLDTRVTRFQQMPAPQGQSFVVVPDDPALQGGIEFGQYADQVRANLSRFGYVPAGNPATADLVVHMRYRVDNGREKLRADYDPFFADPFYGPYGYGGFYRPYFYGHRYMYGWSDPFLWGGYGFAGSPGVTSYTVYTSELDLKIDRRVDQRRLFEGRALAQSRTNNLTYLVPNLIEAMFTGFPGNSGQTVRITVAPPQRR